MVHKDREVMITHQGRLRKSVLKHRIEHNEASKTGIVDEGKDGGSMLHTLKQRKEENKDIRRRRRIIRGCVSVFVLVMAALLLSPSLGGVDVNTILGSKGLFVCLCGGKVEAANTVVESGKKIKSTTTNEYSPSISGAAEFGKTLTVATGSTTNVKLYDDNGTSNSLTLPGGTTTNTVNVQWYRYKNGNYTPIGTNDKTYKLTLADLGYQIVSVIYTTKEAPADSDFDLTNGKKVQNKDTEGSTWIQAPAVGPVAKLNFTSTNLVTHMSLKYKLNGSDDTTIAFSYSTSSTATPLDIGGQLVCEAKTEIGENELGTIKIYSDADCTNELSSEFFESAGTYTQTSYYAKLEEAPDNCIFNVTDTAVKIGMKLTVNYNFIYQGSSSTGNTLNLNLGTEGTVPEYGKTMTVSMPDDIYLKGGTVTLPGDDNPTDGVYVQWYRYDGSALERIEGANQSTYTPGVNDVGKYLSVVVGGTDYSKTTVTSLPASSIKKTSSSKNSVTSKTKQSELFYTTGKVPSLSLTENGKTGAKIGDDNHDETFIELLGRVAELSYGTKTQELGESATVEDGALGDVLSLKAKDEYDGLSLGTFKFYYDDNGTPKLLSNDKLVFENENKDIYIKCTTAGKLFAKNADEEYFPINIKINMRGTLIGKGGTASLDLYYNGNTKVTSSTKYEWGKTITVKTNNLGYKDATETVDAILPGEEAEGHEVKVQWYRAQGSYASSKFTYKSVELIEGATECDYTITPYDINYWLIPVVYIDNTPPTAESISSTSPVYEVKSAITAECVALQKRPYTSSSGAQSKVSVMTLKDNDDSVRFLKEIGTLKYGDNVVGEGDTVNADEDENGVHDFAFDYTGLKDDEGNLERVIGNPKIYLVSNGKIAAQDYNSSSYESLNPGTYEVYVYIPAGATGYIAKSNGSTSVANITKTGVYFVKPVPTLDALTYGGSTSASLSLADSEGAAVTAAPEFGKAITINLNNDIQYQGTPASELIDDKVKIAWVRYKSCGESTDAEIIEGADTVNYTPTAADIGYYLAGVLYINDSEGLSETRLKELFAAATTNETITVADNGTGLKTMKIHTSKVTMKVALSGYANDGVAFNNIVHVKYKDTIYSNEENNNIIDAKVAGFTDAFAYSSMSLVTNEKTCGRNTSATIGTVSFWYSKDGGVTFIASGDMGNTKENIQDSCTYKVYITVTAVGTLLDKVTDKIDTGVYLRLSWPETGSFNQNAYSGSTSPAIEYTDESVTAPAYGTELKVTVPDAINVSGDHLVLPDNAAPNAEVQWYRCNVTSSKIKAPVEIEGATSETYTVQYADIGYYLVAVVYLDGHKPDSILNEALTTSVAYTNRTAGKEVYYIHAGTSVVVPALSIADEHISVEDIPDHAYTGLQVKPDVVVKFHDDIADETLVLGTDYTVSYTSNTSIGSTAYVKITGTGRFTGSRQQYFTIKEKTAITPSVAVEDCEYETDLETVITISGNIGNGDVTYRYRIYNGSNLGNVYYNGLPTDQGSYKIYVSIAETEEYAPTKKEVESNKFTISKKDITDKVTFAPIEDQTYTGAALAPSIVVTSDKGRILEAGSNKDYTVNSRKNNLNVGTATITIKGANNYSGTATTTFEIVAADLADINAAITPIDEQAYTGSEVTPDVEVKFGSRVLVNGTDYDVAYSNNTNIGTATVTVTGKGNFCGTLSTNFDIVNKQTIDPTVSMNDYVYGQDAPVPVVGGNIGNGVVTYQYKVKGSADSTYSTDAPTNAGDYTIRADIAATDEYLKGSATDDFTIEKASIVVTVNMDNYTYVDTPKTPSVTGNDGNGTVSYQYKKKDDADEEYTDTAPTELGDYVVKATIPETDNYFGATVETEFAVEKQSRELTVSMDDYTYGEAAPEPSFACNIDGAEVTYKYKAVSDDDNEYSDDKPVNAGDYIVKAIAAETGEYRLEEATAEFKVNKADLAELSVSMASFNYGGTASVPKVEGNVGAGAETYMYKVRTAADSDYSENIPTEVGKYTVGVTVAETANYKGGTCTADFEILEVLKTLVHPVITMENFTYGTESFKPIVSGDIGDGRQTIEYKIKGADDSTYSSEMPEAAGDYTVRIRIEETDEYAAGEATADFTIEKAELDALTVEMSDYTYGKTAASPSITNNTGNGAVEYTYKEKNAGDDTYAKEAPTNVGEYIVKAVVKETPNYNGKTVTAGFKVLPAEITVTPKAEQTKVYGEADPVLEYTFAGVASADSTNESNILTGSLGRVAGTDVGSYEIEQGTLAIQDAYKVNYTLKLTSGVKFTITDKDITSIASIADIAAQTYTGSAITPNVVVTIIEGDVKKELTAGTDYTVAYDNNINAGDNIADITVTGKGNYTGTASCKFTINKKALELGLTMESYSFVSDPSTPKLTGNAGNGDVTYEYKSDGADDSTYTTIPPTAIGDYVVRAKVAPTSNYEGGSATAEFKVLEKEKEAIAPVISMADFVYGQTAPSPKVTGTVGNGAQSITYKVRGAADDTYTSDVPENAGSYTVRIQIASTVDYKAGEAEADFTISKAELTVTPDTGKSKVYGGTDPELTYDFSGVAAADEEHKDDILTGALTRAAGENAGTYEIEQGTLAIKEAYNNNYTLKIVSGVKFTITGKDITGIVTITDIADQTYTGSAISPTVEATIVEGADKTALIAGTDYSVTYDKNINAGEADVIVTGKGSYTGTVISHFTIVPKALTLQLVMDSYSFGSTASTPSLTGNAGNGTVTYEYKAKDEGDSKYSATVPTDVGEYKVRAAVAATENYLGGECTADFKINARSIKGANVLLAFETAELKEGEKLTQSLNGVKMGDVDLVEDVDYQIVPKFVTEIENVGTYTLVIQGIGNYTGQKSTQYKVTKASTTDPGTEPGTESKTTPGTEPGTKPGTTPETEPGTTPGTGSDTKPIPAPDAPSSGDSSDSSTGSEAKAEGSAITDTVSGASFIVTASSSPTAVPEVKYTGAESDSATVTIPDTVIVDGVSYAVTSISSSAFEGDATVEEVAIGNNVEVIADNAFNKCKKLKKVTVGSNVVSIGKNAFANCTKLTTVSIPNKTETIDANCFAGCTSLKKVTIGTGLKSLKKNTFNKCKKLKTIQIKSTKLTDKNVAKGAFKGIPNGATIKVPKKLVKQYTKLFRKKGLSKKIKVKK